MGNYLYNINAWKLLYRGTLLNRYKMSAFGQIVNYHPNCVDTMRPLQKLCDKIHRNLYPLIHGNIQGLQVAMQTLVFDLDYMKSDTPLHIPIYLPLHAGRRITKS